MCSADFCPDIQHHLTHLSIAASSFSWQLCATIDVNFSLLCNINVTKRVVFAGLFCIIYCT